MIPVAIKDWHIYQRHGEQFLSTALAAHSRQKKTFTPPTLYNLTCMAIEKLVMAFLMKHGDLADNHTMGDLNRAMQRHFDVLPELYERLAYLDSFQEICELDEYNIRVPDDNDVVEILAIGTDIQRHLTPYLEI